MGVYFVRCSTGEIKIGHTDGDPRERLATLQTAHPRPLELLAFAPSMTRDDERALHKRFAAARLSGEWFRPVQELRALVARLPRDLPAPPERVPPAPVYRRLQLSPRAKEILVRLQRPSREARS